MKKAKANSIEKRLRDLEMQVRGPSVSDVQDGFFSGFLTEAGLVRRLGELVKKVNMLYDYLNVKTVVEPEKNYLKKKSRPLW